jgi:CBS domain containing-hemolysin-like protein
LTNAVQIGGALFLVLLNGFFVAAEFSLARARMTRIEQLADSGRASAVLAQRQIRHIDRYLAACQLGITLASLGLGWIGEPAFARILEPLLVGVFGATPAVVHTISLTIAFVVITVLHIVLGEQAPKSFAIRKSQATNSSRSPWKLWKLRCKSSQLS